MKFQSDKKARGEVMAALGLVTHIGLTMAVCVAVGLFAGKWIDGLLGTSPLFLLVMLAAGCGAAIKSVFSQTRRFYEVDDDKDTKRG